MGLQKRRPKNTTGAVVRVRERARGPFVAAPEFFYTPVFYYCFFGKQGKTLAHTQDSWSIRRLSPTTSSGKSPACSKVLRCALPRARGSQARSTALRTGSACATKSEVTG